MRIGLGIGLGVTGGVTAYSRSENLWLQSQTFGTTWLKNPVGLTITSDAVVAPDGTTTADTIKDTADGGGTQHYLEQNTGGSPANGTVLIASVYAKAGTDSVVAIAPNGAATGYTFDLAGGVVGAAVNAAPLDKGIISMGSGWYRCWVKYTYAAATPDVRIYMATSTTNVVYTGAGTGTITLWGAQINTLVLRKYTPTTVSVVTL